MSRDVNAPSSSVGTSSSMLENVNGDDFGQLMEWSSDVDMTETTSNENVEGGAGLKRSRDQMGNEHGEAPVRASKKRRGTPAPTRFSRRLKEKEERQRRARHCLSQRRQQQLEQQQQQHEQRLEQQRQQRQDRYSQRIARQQERELLAQEQQQEQQLQQQQQEEELQQQLQLEQEELQLQQQQEQQQLQQHQQLLDLEHRGDETPPSHSPAPDHDLPPQQQQQQSEDVVVVAEGPANPVVVPQDRPAAHHTVQEYRSALRQVRRAMAMDSIFTAVSYHSIAGGPQSCSICLELYKEYSGVRVLGCGHHFCEVYIDDWYVYNNQDTCPNCRAVILPQ